MKLSPVTWERWHHHSWVETLLLCSWTAPGCLFHNQPTVSDYRLWRTQSRSMSGEWEVILASSCSARAHNDSSLTDRPGPGNSWGCHMHSAAYKSAPSQILFHALAIKGKVGSCLHLYPFLTVCVWPLLIGCVALHATRGPSQGLHVNQMDIAWVDYLPGHGIMCK